MLHQFFTRLCVFSPLHFMFWSNGLNNNVHHIVLTLCAVDVNECDQGLCGMNSTCINTNGSFACSCWTGYTPTNPSLAISTTNPCIGVSSSPAYIDILTVSVTSQAFTRMYKYADYGLKYPEHSENYIFVNADENECNLDPCGGNSTCTNTIGSYNCSCWKGFAANNKSLQIDSTNPCKGLSFPSA